MLKAYGSLWLQFQLFKQEYPMAGSFERWSQNQIDFICQSGWLVLGSWSFLAKDFRDPSSPPILYLRSVNVAYLEWEELELFLMDSLWILIAVIRVFSACDTAVLNPIQVRKSEFMGLLATSN